MANRSIVKTISILIIFTAVVLEPTFGQRWKLRRYEIGAGLGMTQVFGDIGGTAEVKNWYGLKDIKLDETSMAFGALARYKIDPTYSLKGNLVLGFGHGDDLESRNNRGRSYKTKLVEFSIQGEYSFISEERRFRSAAMFNRRGMLNNYASFSAYGFLGLGATFAMGEVSYAPGYEASSTDDLQKGKLGAVAPLGLGLKYIIDDRWLINAELGYRISFSDYIEGLNITHSGNKHKDIYYFMLLSVNYRLESSRKGIPAFLDKDYRKAKRVKTAVKAKPKSKKEALEKK